MTKKAKKTGPEADLEDVATPATVREQEELYGKAVERLNAGDAAHALPMFQAVADGPDVAIRHRARTFVEVCRRKTEGENLEFGTADERYDYAIRLINDRRLDEAERQLEQALKEDAKAAHVHYALAVAAALQERPEQAYERLKRAIELDPSMRIAAKSDSDLALVSQDARIVALLRGEGDVSGEG